MVLVTPWLVDHLRQELEGHETVQARVLRLINDTHATAAQLPDDAVVRDCLADHNGGSPTSDPRMLGGNRERVNVIVAAGGPQPERISCSSAAVQ